MSFPHGWGAARLFDDDRFECLAWPNAKNYEQRYSYIVKPMKTQMNKLREISFGSGAERTHLKCHDWLVRNGMTPDPGFWSEHEKIIFYIKFMRKNVALNIRCWLRENAMPKDPDEWTQEQKVRFKLRWF